MKNLIYKELKVLFRNNRSYWLLCSAFFIPLTLIYLMLNFSAKLISQQIDGINKQKYTIAWISDNNQADELRKKFERHLQIELTDTVKEESIESFLEKDSITAAIVISENFDSALALKHVAEITLHYKTSGRGLGIVQKTISKYRKERLKLNMKESALPEGIINPIEIKDQDYSNMQEMIDNATIILNQSISSLLSIIILIFAFLGSRYVLKRIIMDERVSGLLTIKNQAYIKESLLFVSKVITAALFPFLMVVSAITGFLIALNVNQVGIMESILIQIRDLFNLNSISILILSSFSFSIMMSAFWGIFVFWLPIGKQNTISNLVFIFLLIIFATTSTLGAYTLLIPSINLIYLINLIINGTISFYSNLIVNLVLILSSVFLYLLNFYCYKKICT